MADTFQNVSPTLDGPARRLDALAKSDDETVSFETTRGLWVGTGGDLVVTDAEHDITGGGAKRTIKNVPDGTLLPFRIKKLWSTGTSAADVLGLY